MSPRSKASPSYTPFSKQLTGSLDQISDLVKENAKLMDSIQEVGIELTHSIGTLHGLTVKYAGVANAILDVLLPILRNLPLVPDKATGALNTLELLTQKIIDSQDGTSRTIADVQSGLETGDVTKLRSHAGELQNLSRSLVVILPK